MTRRALFTRSYLATLTVPLATLASPASGPTIVAPLIADSGSNFNVWYVTILGAACGDAVEFGSERSNGSVDWLERRLMPEKDWNFYVVLGNQYSAPVTRILARDTGMVRATSCNKNLGSQFVYL